MLSQKQLQYLDSLSKQERQELISYLQKDNTNNINILESRFKHGLYCPKCGCTEDIVRFGTRNELQRFRCKSCGSIFTETTNTILTRTHKDLNKWEKYIDCMVNKFSIRKCAKFCKISIMTAFVWRHKILEALSKKYKDTKLSGVIEADETFFPLSFKGSRNMPREPRHRGGIRTKRGLSLEQVCVPCGIDRNKNMFGIISNLGKINTQNVEKALKNHIEENSILCTDGEKSYINFTKDNNFQHIVIKSFKKKTGIYHLNHINAYHNGLKKFVKHFVGVATKYLNNYIVWNNLLKKEINFLENILDVDMVIEYKEFKDKNPIPVL